MAYHKRLSEDIGLSVYKHDNEHFHCLIALVLPELSDTVFRLFSWVYHVSFKERTLEWEIQGKKLGEEEDAFFENVERMRRGER